MFGMGSFLILFVITPVIWSLEAKPMYLQSLSKLLPLTLPTEALRSILYRGWNLRSLDVLIGFSTLLAWILIFVIILRVLLSVRI